MILYIFTVLTIGFQSDHSYNFDNLLKTDVQKNNLDYTYNHITY